MLLDHVQPLTKLPSYDPCIAFYSANYLNLPDVQKAMHANTSGFIDYPWQLCKYVSPQSFRSKIIQVCIVLLFQILDF